MITVIPGGHRGCNLAGLRRMQAEEIPNHDTALLRPKMTSCFSTISDSDRMVHSQEDYFRAPEPPELNQ